MPHPGGAKVASERRSGRNVASEGLKRVKDRVEGLKRAKCRIRGRKIAWRDEAGEMLRLGGVVAGGASVEACLHAKESRPIDGFEEKSLSHAKATIIRLKWRP